MTKLGKIFTTIMMLLSVMFFMAAVMVNATHVDYTEALNDPFYGLKAVAQREQAKKQDLTDAIQKLKDEIVLELASRRSALAALQTQFEQLDFDVKEKEKELATKQTELTQLATTDKDTKDELIKLGQANEETKAQLQQARAERDAQFQKVRQAYSELLKLQGEHKTLQTQYNQMNPSASTELSPSDVR
ncbi:MAG: hypothetical protein IT423_02705 [Pirellulaceae bacterium]|nr:hypothetical protein [Pirellulaceae bacterium]